MKTKMYIYFSILYFFQFSYGQNYRVVYELSYRPDSLSSEIQIKYYVLNLDIRNQTSYFHPFDPKKDSIQLGKQNILKNKGTISINNENQYDISPVIIEKNYGNQSISYYFNIDGNFFVFKENEDLIKWEINGNGENVLNYKTVHAQASIGKRRLYALFSNDIPIPDGPYNFYGLPGLILNIEDSKTNFIFKAIAIESESINSYKFDSKRYVTVDKQRFAHYLENYLKNPFQSMKEGVIVDKETGIKIIMEKGFDKDFIKQQEIDFKQYYKINNNCILLDDIDCKVRKTSL